MYLARDLVSGTDLWLNTPRRPREASGTSGQKAALCGAPNFSVLDGWWDEGYNGTNGWEIGEERPYKDEHTQDEADADSLYHTLENEIIPLFFHRNIAGIPVGWVQVMKNAIRTCAPLFSMQRMVIDYVEDYYLPASRSGIAYRDDAFAAARKVASWKDSVANAWNRVRLSAEEMNRAALYVGDSVEVSAKLRLPASLSPDDVKVEAVVARHDSDGDGYVDVIQLDQSDVLSGEYRYRGAIAPAASGRLDVGVRVRPYNPLLVNEFEVGQIRWA